MEKLKSYNKRVHESVLDPTHDKLSDNLWDSDQKLKSSVKKQIVDRYEVFAKEVKLNLKIVEIILVGSMTGYNYAEDTDIDVHIELDTKDENRIKRLRKIAPSGEILKGTKHPINYYLMFKGEQPESRYRGIYNILEDKWIKKDHKEKFDPNDFWQMAMVQAVSWGRKIALDVDELRRDMMEIKLYKHFLELDDINIDKEALRKQIKTKEAEIKADYDVLVINPHVLREFRSEAHKGEKFDSQIFPKDVPSQADFSLNNVIFKILEKLKYWEMGVKIKEKCEEEFPELIDNE